MPNYQTRTPEPISVTLELGTGNVRIAASNRTDTVVEVRPSDEADESDVKTAQQVRVDYAGGMLRVTGPKPGAFDFSRKTRSVDVSIELPSGSQVSLETQVGGVHCAISVDRAGAGVDAKTSNGSIRLGEVARGSIVLGTPAGDLEIGIAEGTAARLAVSTGHGHVRNLLESATGPEEADETVELRGRTSYGDITIHRS